MASTIGTARGTTQGSWRPRARSSVSLPSRVTFGFGQAIDVAGRMSHTKGTTTLYSQWGFWRPWKPDKP